MKKLTTSQVATRLGVGKSTVNLWCNQGRFPNAESVLESRGAVWYIPESDLKDFVKPTPGRPRKPATEKPKRTRIKKGG
jgi:transcriptional regulator with XRE-family HTH domain